jgi:hypothetical protein
VKHAGEQAIDALEGESLSSGLCVIRVQMGQAQNGAKSLTYKLFDRYH